MYVHNKCIVSNDSFKCKCIVVKATKYKVGFKLVRWLLGLGILMVMQNKALVCAL